MDFLRRLIVCFPLSLFAVSGYVPCVSGDRIVVFDVDTETISTTISVGTLPTWIAFVGQYGFMTSYGGSSVYVIDSVSNTVVGSPIVVEGNPVFAANYGKYVYVLNSTGGSGQGSVSVIDSSTRTVVATILSSSFDTPYAIAFINHYGYVANVGTNTVSVIDTDTNQVVKVITLDPTTGAAPKGIAIYGIYAYVANSWSPGAITVINTMTNAVVGTISSLSFSSPSAVAFANQVGFVSNNGSNTATAFSPITNTVISTFAIDGSPGTAPYGMAAYAQNQIFKVYVAIYGGSALSIINPNTFAYSQIDNDLLNIPNSVGFPNPVNFATQFKGERKTNNFGTVREYFNNLTWTAATGSNVAGYQLFRDGSRIAVLNGAASTSYQDHNRPPSQSAIYVLYAMDSNGNLSIPQAIEVIP